MSMRNHEYTVGEVVFAIEHNGKPSRRTKVTAVKDYKRGQKVTTADGSEWDPNNGGHFWGQRSVRYNTGSRLAPHTDKLAAQYKALVSKSFVNWALHRFEELTAEQQERLADVIGQIKREHKNKEQG